MISHCLMCDAEFDETVDRGKFCSGRCRGKFYRENKKIVRVCVVCGEEFENKDPTKSCSDKCRKQHRKNKLRENSRKRNDVCHLTKKYGDIQ